MTLKGIPKLPIEIDDKIALKIYRKIAVINGKIGRLNSELNHSIINDNFINIMSIRESLESTKIEGTQVTFDEVLEEKMDKNPSNEVKEVLNYMDALSYGFEQITTHNRPLSTKLIKELHTILLTGTRGKDKNPGNFRKIQNFIGPDNKIENATYIPIEANLIEEYMTNLEYFMNGMEHQSLKEEPFKTYFNYNADPLIRTAISHAQFESIHPFLDGNGRLGRILIILMLVNAKTIEKPVFFVSEELEKEKARYYDLLNGVRSEKSDWQGWITFFLQATERMIDSILLKISNSESLYLTGANLLHTSSEKLIWFITFQEPKITVRRASEITKLSQPTVRRALKKLAELDLIYEEKSKKRNRTYNNYELLRIINN
ncbi:Fic family protein [Staphylococcus caprae]|uniref:Fic family protein n=1 Tax=Staphylococcus caprae TaxID=29380 RepID=UPI000E687930|nr:Fic/DOC family N-terminal domain-containing protein [Staphylococcus caprae]MDK6297386.1 Fic family protein [Staphylococcus caprae]MDK7233790.1 Fic family protein [Staphylococcus caprae]RIM36264.1 Fic family protein [Staphylococcus caprae]